MPHEMKRTITEFIVIPDHEKRTGSSLFAKNKRTLVKQLDLPCWVCGSRDAREVHHLHEWSLWNALDPEKVLDTLHIFDPYGYTHNMGECVLALFSSVLVLSAPTKITSTIRLL